MNKKFQAGKVISISMGHFFHDIYPAFLAPLLPLLIAKLGISLSLAALLDVIRKVPSLINPFIGLLADKLSIKYLIILTPGITAITMSFLCISPSYIFLVILLFTAGISSALFHVPSPVMIKQFSGDKTAKGMSYYMFGGEIARTIGPLIITAAVYLWGLEGSYRVMILGMIASIILFIKLKNLPSFHNIKDKGKQKSVRKNMRSLIKLFISVSGFLLFRSGIKLALTLYLPTYLIIKGESLWFAGISLAILQLSGAVGTIVSGHISDKIGYRNTLLITSIAIPAVMFAFIIFNKVIMIPLLILMGLLLFASGPILLAMIQETNTNRPAFVNSIFMTLNFGISSLIALTMGFIGDRIGLEITFKICAILGILSIPFLFILPKRKV